MLEGSIKQGPVVFSNLKLFVNFNVGLSLFRAWGFFALPQVFLIPLPNAAIHSAHTWWLFLKKFIVHISAQNKKTLSQDRSDHQSEFVDPTSEKNGITLKLEFFTDQFFFSGLHYSNSICNLYIAEVLYFGPERSGQNHHLYITSLWQNIEMRPASSKRVKTTQFCQDYDRLSYLQWPRCNLLTLTPRRVICSYMRSSIVFSQ